MAHMKFSIEIESGNQGVFLKVNGFAIKKAFDNSVLITPCNGKPNMWIATEFANVTSLREFWRGYRQIILSKIANYDGVLISEKYQIPL